MTASGRGTRVPIKAGSATQSDVDVIVDMLWTSDSAAFARRHWEDIAADFDDESFVGHVCGPDPTRWSLAYPTLASYRDAWLAAAHDLPMQDETQALEFTLSSSTITDVEVRDDRATVRKSFHDPGTARETGVTMYLLRRISGAWKIVGFTANLRPAAQ